MFQHNNLDYQSTRFEAHFSSGPAGRSPIRLLPQNFGDREAKKGAT
jgi:hypothetical protein